MNLILLECNKRKVELETRIGDRMAWDQYNQRMEEENYDRVQELDELEMHSMNQADVVLRDRLITGVKILQVLNYSRYGYFLSKLSEFLSEKATRNTIKSFNRSFTILRRLFINFTSKIFNEIKENSIKKLEEISISTDRKRKEQSIYLHKVKFDHFSRLLDKVIQKKRFKEENYFLNRLLIKMIAKSDYNSVKALDRLLRKLIIVRMGPCFTAISVTRRDNYSADTIEKFNEMMVYFINNRFSVGFSSIQSYLLEFEVLKVQQIDQDDYKDNNKVKFMFLEQVDKYKTIDSKLVDNGEDL